MIKIAVAGPNGRMGQALLTAVQNDPQTELVATISHQDEKKNLTEVLNHKTDVLINFTSPEATLAHLEFCHTNKIKMVIGTTGFSEDQKNIIQKSTKNIPIVFAPNMSMGTNIIFKLLEIASKIISENISPEQFDIGILDIHHKHKKDVPSGTAFKMREVIQNSMDVKNGKNIKSAMDTKKEIKIGSLRIGEICGEHSVLFTLPNEEIQITHKAFNRMIFAQGAVQAAKWLANNNNPGLYSMKDVLGI